MSSTTSTATGYPSTGSSCSNHPRAQRTTRSPTRPQPCALAILDDLAEDTTPQLCHGDTSPWNILALGHDTWVLIDPRGVSGEVAYDVAVLALKLARGRSAAFITAPLAGAVGVDPERVHAWALIADAARV